LVFIPTVQMLLTFDSGMNEVTLVQDSIVLTASFSFVGMTVLGENGEHKQLDLSLSLWTSGLIAMVGLLFTGNSLIRI